MPGDPRELVQDFRKAGYDDWEIHQILLSHQGTRGLIDAMRTEGHKDQEIFKFFGLAPKSPSEAKYGAPEAVATGAAAVVPGVDVGPRVMAGAQALREGLRAGGEREPLLSIKAPRNPFSGEETESVLPGVPAPGESGRTVLSAPWAKGTFSGGDFGSKYEQALDQYRGSRERYHEENPVGATVAELGGSLLPALAGGGLVNAGLRGLSRAVPAAAPATEFALGNAGYSLAGRALPGVGNFASRVGSNAVQGAVQGATGATLSSGLNDTPLMDQLESGSALGALVGGTAGTAGRALVNLAKGAPVSPRIAALADEAINRSGIPLRSSTFSNSPVAKGVEKARAGIPFSGKQEQMDAEMAAFTREIGHTIGLRGHPGWAENPNLDSAAMASAAAANKALLDHAAQRTTIRYDRHFDQRLNNILTDASQTVADEGALRVLQRQVDNIRNGAMRNNGDISGQMYQNLTAKGGQLDRVMKNPAIKYHAQQVRSALDDALQMYAPADAQAALRIGRMQWKNMKTIEDIVEHLGADKQFTPAEMKKLLNEAIDRNSGWAYHRQGELGTLAEIGQNFLQHTKSELKESKSLGRTIMGADVAANVLTHGGLAALSAHPLAHLADMASSPGVMAGTAALLGAPMMGARYAGRRFVNPAARQRLIDEGLGRNAPRMPGLVERAMGNLAGETAAGQGTP